MNVVFDSGVWISAMHFGGTPRNALDVASKRGKIAICNPILEEIHRVLRAKLGWRPEEVDRALIEYVSDIFHVTIVGSIQGVCRDPNDDMVLGCAIAAGASVIVSGDKDLLALGEYQDIRILTPRGFLDEFAAPHLL